MNKLSIILLTILVSIFFFAVGFKVGDSRGFEDGYKVGYAYDCQAEIRQLRSAQEDLKKSIEFAAKKSLQIQEENSYLKYQQRYLIQNPSAIDDSVRIAPDVAKRSDSLKKHDKLGDVRVNPYTGKVEKGVLRLLKESR